MYGMNLDFVHGFFLYFSTMFLSSILIHRYLIVVGKDAAFDYISVTPPYMLVDYEVLMNQVSNSPVVGENTFIVRVSHEPIPRFHSCLLKS